jgi:hypothetical protein
LRQRSIPYGEREVRPVYVPGQVDVSEPVAGFYRLRLGRDTITGGVRLWFGPPHDPVTGEELDRSWRWQAEFNGEVIDFDRVWPVCAGDQITEQEYQRYIARRDWARENAPDSAYAERGRRLDPLSTKSPLPF